MTAEGETFTAEEAAWLFQANILEENGNACNRLNQLNEALDYYQQSHALILRLLPNAEEHPSVWQALAVGCGELCRMYRRLRRVSEARPYAVEGIAYARKAVEYDPCLMSNRTLSALYGDLGDVLFLEQQWEESYEQYSLAYKIAGEIVREKNDALSRQDLAFSARKRGDALARMGAAGRAKELYLESIRLVAYAPEELMSPSSNRMVKDTADNFLSLQLLDADGDTRLYSAVAELRKLLAGFTEAPAASDQYRINLGLLCNALSTVLDLAACKEDAEVLRMKAGEYLGEEKAETVPGDDEALQALAEQKYQEGTQRLGEGRLMDARKKLQQAAELYNVLDTRQTAFTPVVAKYRADVVFQLAQTYFPEKDYREITAAYNFCHAQYERIYQTTQSGAALLDLVSIKRAASELLEAVGEAEQAVRWIRTAIAMLSDYPDTDPALPGIVETARCYMAAAALTQVRGRERKRFFKQAQTLWRRAYAQSGSPEYLQQAERCADGGRTGK